MTRAVAAMVAYRLIWWAAIAVVWFSVRVMHTDRPVAAPAVPAPRALRNADRYDRYTHDYPLHRLPNE